MPNATLKTVAGRHASPDVDAYRTTGTSPTSRRAQTVHLLGPGAVGRAFLARLAADHRTLVAVTDSTATLYNAHGLDCNAVIQWKSTGRSLCEHPAARAITIEQAIALADADLVIDTSATDLDRPGWSAALDDVLARGRALALAAKAALCDNGATWLSGDAADRVGLNAVLGGTGRAFAQDLPLLTNRWRGVAIVGNASTTAIIEAVERGASFADGVAEAQRLGYLEPDPELDLRGVDAAVKLAIVAGVLTRRRIDPRAIACDDIRQLDLRIVRARPRRHATTRLVGRLHADGSLRVAYEEVQRDSLLAAPCGRVVYEYQLDYDERRLHIGSGLGAAATAAALWDDATTLVTRTAACATGGTQ